MAAGIVSDCPRCGGKMLGTGSEVSCINCGHEGARNGASPILSLETLTTAQLGEAAIVSLKRLARRMRELDDEQSAVRDEASRFFSIAKFCEVDVPEAILVRFGKRKSGKAARGTAALGAKPRKCSCGMESTAAAIGNHLKANPDHEAVED